MTQNAEMQKMQIFDFLQIKKKQKWKYLRFVPELLN